MVEDTAKLGNGNRIDVIKRGLFYYIYQFTEKTLVIAVCRINKYRYVKLDKIKFYIPIFIQAQLGYEKQNPIKSFWMLI